MKKLFTMAAIALFTLVSCSQDEDSTAVINQPPPSTPTTTKMLVKEMLVTSPTGVTTLTKFEYIGTHVKKIIYGLNDFEEFEYNEYGEISYMGRTVNGQLSDYSELSLNEMGDVRKRTRYVIEGPNEEPTIYITNVSHNTSSIYATSTFPEDNHTQESTEVIRYTNNFGNISYKENVTQNTSSSYTYNNKFSPYFYWADSDNMLIIFPHISNNCQTFEQKYINGVHAGQYRYEYIYNDHNYPVEAKKYNHANDQLLETITYTYYTL